MGKGYEGTLGPNPHGPAAAKLLTAFDQFVNDIAARLMAQTQLEELYGAISYKWYETA